MAKNDKWYELDNAAKIVPSTTVGADTRVFRITCELKEEVQPDILQRALDKSIREFPHFQCVLKQGLFWYYLEASSRQAKVFEECLPPCHEIYKKGRKELLYRLFYYKKRINLEMFHVLSDGTGAFIFLKSIVSNYLVERYHLDPGEKLEDPSSVREKEGDAFSHFYTEKQKKNWLREKLPEKAYRLKGEKDENLQNRLLEGTVSVKKLLDKAHEYNATIAVLVTAVYIEAIMQEMTVRDRKSPVVISVPVNLRNYFPSHTTRNFFGVINVPFYYKEYDGGLAGIVENVRKSFKEMLSEEQVFKTMNSYAALEHNRAVKIVPLTLKDLGIRGISSLMQRGVTSTVSNVGKVTMPEIMVPYIEKFSSFMSTNSVQMCISSFQDVLTFGVTTAFTDNTMIMHFFRRLVDLGIPVELATTGDNVQEVKKRAVLSKVQNKHKGK